ncbi:hypothetical protein ACOSQ4_012670 [Xanthoceras sorbifolium]
MGAGESPQPVEVAVGTLPHFENPRPTLSVVSPFILLSLKGPEDGGVLVDVEVLSGMQNSGVSQEAANVGAPHAQLVDDVDAQGSKVHRMLVDEIGDNAAGLHGVGGVEDNPNKKKRWRKSCQRGSWGLPQLEHGWS